MTHKTPRPLSQAPSNMLKTPEQTSSNCITYNTVATALQHVKKAQETLATGLKHG